MPLGFAVHSPPFSPLIFLGLLLPFGVSVWVFVILCRRWVEHRPVAALRDWSYQHRFKIRFAPKAAICRRRWRI